MRRLFVLLLAAGLLGPVAGCKHINGFCDCDDGCGCACRAGTPPVGTPTPWMTAGGAAAPDMVPVAAPGAHPAPARQRMPNAEGVSMIQPTASVVVSEVR